MNTVRNTHSCLLCGFNVNEKLTFSRIPAKKTRKKLWLQQCGLDPSTNTSEARLCCKHFREEDFKVTQIGRRLLKPTAVPSIFFHKNDMPREKEIYHLTQDSTQKKYRNYFHSCIVCGHRGANISFYSLPKNEDVRKKWLAHFNIDSTDFRVNVKDPRICGLHVREQPSEMVSIHCRNRKILIPVIEKGVALNLEDKNVLSELETTNTKNSTVNHEGEMDVDDGANQTKEIPIPPSANLQSVVEEDAATLKTTNSSIFETPSTSNNGRKCKKRMPIFPRYPNDIKSLDIAQATPQIQRSLQISSEYIQKQKKTIASLQQTVRQAKKKIRNLEDMLKNLIYMNNDLF